MQTRPETAKSFASHQAVTGNWRATLRAAGLVFGDIGTSPIYTMTIIFLLLPSSAENIVGVVSLIIWTLAVIVFGQYVFLAMHLNHAGEGGTLILKRIADQYVQTGKLTTVIGIMAFLGAAFILGDGVITPAISILSAVEGVRLISGFEHLSTIVIVVIAVMIAVGLFVSQPWGGDRVGIVFGPVMALFFFALGLTGLLAILETPAILKALNPYYALVFCRQHGIATFLILAQVVLCVTGAEALYADMGHVGRQPIIRASRLVFLALVLSYLGQGAFLMHKPEATVLLFGLVHHQSQGGYIPFLVLSILATVIASQSLISGAFSIISQAVNLGKFPPMKIDFTSVRLKSQVYIGAVNWALMGCVIFMMVYFRKSENLGAAYGLAVTGTMAITTALMMVIYYRQKAWVRFAACLPLFLVNAAFFGSCLTKFPTGGYWSLIIALFPLGLLLTWSLGEARLARLKIRGATSWPEFLARYLGHSSRPRLPGAALFSLIGQKGVPPYIINCMFEHGILYEQNILVSVVILNEPNGFTLTPLRSLAKGLAHIEIHIGYMELKRDLKQCLDETGIEPRVIFYGEDRIDAASPWWVPYAILKRLARNFTWRLRINFPGMKLHGIISRVDM